MPKPKQSQSGMTLAKRADFLLSRLGYDPREAVSFRAGVMGFEAAAVAPLSADPVANLATINASPYVRTALTTDEVHLHTVEAASTRYMADRYAFLSAKTIANIADDCRAGIAFMTRHAVGGDFSGPGENPYGRTFAGAVDQKGDVTRVLAQFYMLRAHSPNGSSAPSTDDLHKGLNGGTLFDFSIGLAGGGFARRTCDVCKNELFSMQCPHCPGTTYGMTDEEITAQKARGIPDGKASFTFDDCHAGELSLVFNGAIPGASTAFSAQRGRIAPAMAAATMEDGCSCCSMDSSCACPSNDAGACSCDGECQTCIDNGCDGMTAMAATEEPMFTAELKASLGLAATATDAEVTAKLAENQTRLAALSTENDALKLAQKTAADNAFVVAWTGKLSAETIESLKGLPNRDALATSFAAQLAAASTGTTVQVPPPIGDPLKGTGLAAAPVTPQTPKEGEESAIFRRALGKFKTPEELAAFAVRGPIEALEKWLSTSGTQVTLTREPLHENFERQTIAGRKAMLGMTS